MLTPSDCDAVVRCFKKKIMNECIWFLFLDTVWDRVSNRLAENIDASQFMMGLHPDKLIISRIIESWKCI